MRRDRWRELCDSVAEDDGLPTWDEAGHWTLDKLRFWHRYIDITTTAMVGNPSWPGGLAYVDLFAESGICTLRGTQRRFPGSALIAANAVKPFSKIIVCEKDPVHAEACMARLDRTSARDRCRLFLGDCNQLIGGIVGEIPRGCLTLAFVDPKGLDAKFRTISTLASRARVDFVILFAHAVDVSRNVEHVYRQDPHSKLDQFLGPGSRWREKLDGLDVASGVHKRWLFAEIYKSQLQRHLQYCEFDDKTIEDKGRPLYKLIYASRHKLGLKFWRQAVKKDASGQRDLFD